MYMNCLFGFVLLVEWSDNGGIMLFLVIVERKKRAASIVAEMRYMHSKSNSNCAPSFTSEVLTSVDGSK